VLRTQEHTAGLTAWIALLRAHAATTRGLGARLAEYGLSLNDYEALLHVSQADGGRMRRVDLADRLQLSPSGVTRLLEGLEALGLMERHVCTSDLRVAYAVITAAGRERLAQASCSHLGAVRSVFDDRFDEAELVLLGELLDRLTA
jgi:DNA-binding MarR family transcriptional regulator